MAVQLKHPKLLSLRFIVDALLMGTIPMSVSVSVPPALPSSIVQFLFAAACLAINHCKILSFLHSWCGRSPSTIKNVVANNNTRMKLFNLHIVYFIYIFHCFSNAYEIQIELNTKTEKTKLKFQQ